MKKFYILRTVLFSVCLLFPYISNAQWSGTGFSIGGRYMVTNNHVVEGASKVSIGGTKDGLSFEYAAEVIAKDSANDLAILRIVDSKFEGFGNIPYLPKTQLAEIGEDVFALGYPLVQTMGSDIKLSTGIISSQSGYQNDVTLYQISAPIQPGNSGGPLFDYNGNLIGVICAKHKGAENVNYAIKASYLMSLINSVNLRLESPIHNIISTLSLPEKVKKIRDFVFIVKCYSQSQQHVEPSQSNVNEACKMYYTTSDSTPVKILSTSFDANIVSNICKEGKGVVVFSAPITRIGVSAFGDCNNLTGIAIPNSVKEIGENAFRNCESLTRVIIGENLAYIGDNAFYGCSEIKRVDISDLSSWCKISFKGSPFTYGKAKLYINNEEARTLIIPNDITEIKEKTFGGISNLVNVIIGDHVHTIGDRAFWFCENLKDVVIGEGVTSIGNEVFFECSSLASIRLGQNIVFIGEGTFYECVNLASVTIPNKVKSIERTLFYGCERLASITIPNSVTSIGEMAFYSCKNLANITLPNSITSIGKNAFCFCESLTSVTIPTSVTSIDKSTFAYCSNIKSFYGKFASDDHCCLIINGVLTQFAIGSGVDKYTIPNSVKTIGATAFGNCHCLSNITIPNSVVAIERKAFACCSLRSISIPDSVTSIGREAFSHCWNLSSVMVGAGVSSIGSSVFLGCERLAAFYGKFASKDNNCLIVDGKLICFAIGSGVDEYTIPQGVISVNGGAFRGCASLKKISIPNSVTYIGAEAFKDCLSLKNIFIPSSVKKIAYSAFYGCTSLKMAVFKSTEPPSIGWSIFNYQVGDSMVNQGYIGCDIYVPQKSISAYKSAPNWSDYADYIVGYDFE